MWVPSAELSSSYPLKNVRLQTLRRKFLEPSIQMNPMDVVAQDPLSSQLALSVLMTSDRALMVLNFPPDDDESPTVLLSNAEGKKFFAPLLEGDDKYSENFWSTAAYATEKERHQTSFLISDAVMISAKYKRLVTDDRIYVVITAKLLDTTSQPTKKRKI
ncbi:hypothetical protein PROFUN_03292 [Planoprotostelium fungivorum]|uniref:Uncharacterized protein n=1 Tax=Planoprotostelium fungivorum TaxID=1890364 RepID=A0A2P6NWW7_9EUKA|nr:hypothetical protein PROFUN_03292 [Planoprotostelium fungivorum]